MHVVVHMLILLVPLIAINCIKNLKILAPFSTFANVITFVGEYWDMIRRLSKSREEFWTEAFKCLDRERGRGVKIPILSGSHL